jgi:glycerol-3-phosphate acyltransferase PlsY
MLAQLIVLIVGAYILGSVPTSYIAGRLIKGIDIRDYGSGVVSGSNVWHNVVWWAVIPVGIFDILKGFAPVYIAWAAGLTLFDEAILAQGVVGMAAIAGHSWSIFLRFSGGRGISTMMGALSVLAPWELLVFIGICMLGIALINSPVGALTAEVALPLVSWGFSEPLVLTLCLMGVSLLLIAKRLVANDGLSAFTGERRQVLLCRLVLDRDVFDRDAWIYRGISDLKRRREKTRGTEK